MAEQLMTECMQDVQAAGDRGGLAWLYQHLGHVALQWGVLDGAQQADHFEQARQRFRESIKLARLEGHPITIAFATLGSAGLASATARPEVAARLWSGANALKVSSQSVMSALDHLEYGRLAGFIQQHLDLPAPVDAASAGSPSTLEQVAEMTLNEL
jgi:hypothetical protein